MVISAWASALKSVFEYKHCSLSESNGIQTRNHLVCKRTFNRLAKLAKWLSCVVNTYLYGAFVWCICKYLFVRCISTIECGFTLKLVRDMTMTYSRMQHTDKYSQLSSIIWSVWLNGLVFVYKLSGCGFESRCCHLNFRYGTCFEQGVLWHSGKLWSVDSLWNWFLNNINRL